MKQLLPKCETSYYPDFLSIEQANALFKELTEQYDLLNRTITMADGSYHEMQNSCYLFTDPELTSFEKLPAVWGGRSAWPKSLETIRDHIETITGIHFHVARAVYYQDGSDGIDFHCDLPAYGPTDVIASLSLGAVRPFILRDNQNHTQHLTLNLAHGSLFIMGNGCQEHYEHALPRDNNCHSPRLNLTFRQYGH